MPLGDFTGIEEGKNVRVLQTRDHRYFAEKRVHANVSDRFGGQYLDQKPSSIVGMDEEQFVLDTKNQQGYPGAQPVPDWLKQYMDTQPATDPYSNPVPSKVDMVNSNKYLSEREKLKMLKSLKDTGKLF